MPSTPEKQVAAQPWAKIEQALDARGFAVTDPLLTPRACTALARLYDQDTPFRSRIVMARHGYGEGEYKYLAYPLPPVVAALRRALYPRLLPLARRWAERLGLTTRYPEDLEGYLRICHDAGQTRPTPLLLRYRAGGYNCLHQDLYGALAFPLQAAVLLSRPGTDFAGGELLLVEQRPRAQSRGQVVPLEQGQAVIFANALRPVEGKRGFYRVNLRHGVSSLTAGERLTLGIIFHDAQ